MKNATYSVQNLEKMGPKSVRPPTLSLKGDRLLVLQMQKLIKNVNKGTVYLATKWHTFNNTDDNSFDKDIPDADRKKIIQHYFKLKKDMRGEYMSYVWRMWRKRDIRRHGKREAMYYHKAGSLCIFRIM